MIGGLEIAMENVKTVIDECAVILSNISDLDYKTTKEILFQIKNEFDIETREGIYGFVNNLNELQNNYPVPLSWLSKPTIEQSINFSVSAYQAINSNKLTPESGEFLIHAMKSIYDMRSDESLLRINESKRISELLISQLENENFKRLINMALDSGNKELFMKLTTKKINN